MLGILSQSTRLGGPQLRQSDFQPDGYFHWFVYRIGKMGMRSSHISQLVPHDLFYRIGYPIGNTNCVIYRYVRGEIHRPTPHCTPIAPVCGTCMGVTIALSVKPHLTPTTLDITISDIPTRMGNPWVGRPPGGGPHRAAVPNLILP